MRLIDADKIVLDYSGLAHIPPNDFVGRINLELVSMIAEIGMYSLISI